MTVLNLMEKNENNLNRLVAKIREKLQIVNPGMLRSEDFPLSAYDRIYELYTFLDRQQSVSTFQIDAVLTELKAIKTSAR